MLPIENSENSSCRPRRRLCFLDAHLLITSGVEEQRLIVPRFKMLHLADIQCVVAGRMRVDHLHNEVRDRAFEKRNPLPSSKVNSQILDSMSSEVVAQQLLIFRQHANAEAPNAGKYAMHVGAIVQRNEHERRVERHGHKRVGRHAVRTFLVTSGNHGYAAGETS